MTNQDSVSVAIIICTHNGGDRLRSVVGELLVNTSYDQEIVVVDNGSTDGVPQALSQPTSRATVRIVSEPRLGLTFARNAGMNATSAPMVIFVDDDNFLDPSYVDNAIALMERHPLAAAAGGFAEATFQGVRPSWFDEFQHYFACGPQAVTSGVLPPGSFLRGAGLVVRRDAWNALKVVRKELRLTDRKGSSLTTGGDAELCLMWQVLGYELVYEPSLYLKHFMTTRRLDRSYLIRLAYQNGRASVVLDGYVSRLVGWRPSNWRSAIGRALLDAVPRTLSLATACRTAWQAGRIRQLAKDRQAYGVIAENVATDSGGCTQ